MNKQKHLINNEDFKQCLQYIFIALEWETILQPDYLRTKSSDGSNGLAFGPHVGEEKWPESKEFSDFREWHTGSVGEERFHRVIDGVTAKRTRTPVDEKQTSSIFGLVMVRIIPIGRGWEFQEGILIKEKITFSEFRSLGGNVFIPSRFYYFSNLPSTVYPNPSRFDFILRVPNFNDLNI